MSTVDIDGCASGNGDGKWRILLLASLREHCGNYSTALRIQSHYSSQNIVCILCDANRFLSQDDVIDIIKKHHITALILLHAYRAGKWICGLDQRLPEYQLPYAVIYGGTDLNSENTAVSVITVMNDVISRARCLVVFSSQMKQKALSVWPSLKDRDFRCIPQAPVITEVLDNCDIHQQILKQYKLSSDCKLFTLVTGIRPVKDPCFLLRAFTEFHLQHRQAVLLIIGPVLDEEFAIEFRRELDSCCGVIYIGARASYDTHALMKRSYAAVNCSRSEGMSVAILEAMALSVPVIARDIPGNSTIIEHQNTGLLFSDPQEFVKLAETLLDDAELYETLRKNAKDYVSRHHSLEAERAAYLSLAKELHCPTVSAPCVDT